MTTKSKNPLDNSATHLLHRAGQRAADIFAEEAKKGGLTPRQYAVLTAVSLEEGLPQAELVARTGIDRSTLADIVARLLGRGLIQRRRAKEDGRAYAIKLSAKGTRALSKAQPAAKAADSQLLAGMSATKQNEFLQTLSRIVAAGED